MKCCAIVIDNRIDKAFEAQAKHYPYIPESWGRGTFTKLNTSTIRGYNEVLTSSTFWEQFLDFDRVLIFQHDSALLRHGIEEFLEWDYVGAPWKFQEHGGNGGLSIRNPFVMYRICEMFKYDHSCNEDLWLCNIMKGARYKLAPREVCAKFSCEAIYAENTLGYHAIDKYLTPEQCNQIRCQYK